MGRPPIRVSLHRLRLLLRLLLLLLLLLLRLMLLRLLLRLVLRVGVRMRSLSDVSWNVSAVRVRTHGHLDVIVFVGRAGSAGRPRRLIGGVVAVGAAHRAHAGAPGTGGYGGGGGRESGAVTRVGGGSRVIGGGGGGAHGLMVMAAPSVGRRIFMRNPVRNV